MENTYKFGAVELTEALDYLGEHLTLSEAWRQRIAQMLSEHRARITPPITEEELNRAKEKDALEVAIYDKMFARGVFDNYDYAMSIRTLIGG